MSVFLKFLERNNRLRLIKNRAGTATYMKRYYLLFNGEKPTLSTDEKIFNIMLHNILLSDDEEDLHDHPWWYFTIILKGGYWETTPTGKFWRRPGYFSYRPATSLHRIDLGKKDSWSLFIRGRNTRDWGFLKDKAWIPHSIYLKEKLENVKKN